MGLDVFANVGHVTLSGAVELMRGPGVLDGITYLVALRLICNMGIPEIVDFQNSPNQWVGYAIILNTEFRISSNEDAWLTLSPTPVCSIGGVGLQRRTNAQGIDQGSDVGWHAGIFVFIVLSCVVDKGSCCGEVEPLHRDAESSDMGYAMQRSLDGVCWKRGRKKAAFQRLFFGFQLAMRSLISPSVMPAFSSRGLT